MFNVTELKTLNTSNRETKILKIKKRRHEMFKIDKVKTLFDCSLCNQLLVDPVTIPCGNSICKKHL